MRGRLATTIAAAFVAACVFAAPAMGAPAARTAVKPAAVAQVGVPVSVPAGAVVHSRVTTSSPGAELITALLSTVQKVAIGADKSTVVVGKGAAAHPITVEYGSLLYGGPSGNEGLARIVFILVGAGFVMRVFGILGRMMPRRANR